MSKKLYHIPLIQTIKFIENNKDILNNYTNNKSSLEYFKLLGKSYYYLEIEEFIKFFKINKDIDYALNSMEYFNSKIFLDKIYQHLNFSQFDLKENNISQKDFFYAFCYLFYQKNIELFKFLLQKIFIHYHTTFNPKTKIYIDYKELSHLIIQRDNRTIRESFGEDNNSSFFKIFIDDKLVIDKRGKNIKTLRKIVYKKVLFLLI